MQKDAIGQEGRAMCDTGKLNRGGESKDGGEKIN